MIVVETIALYSRILAVRHTKKPGRTGVRFDVGVDGAACAHASCASEKYMKERTRERERERERERDIY